MGLGRCWGFKNNVQTQSICGGDMTLQKDARQSWPTQRNVKVVVSR